MFFSVSSLGVASEGAWVCAAVPVVLGGLNIFPSFGYLATGIAFVLASANFAFPSLLPQLGQLYSVALKAGGVSSAPIAAPVPTTAVPAAAAAPAAPEKVKR